MAHKPLCLFEVLVEAGQLGDVWRGRGGLAFRLAARARSPRPALGSPGRSSLAVRHLAPSALHSRERPGQAVEACVHVLAHLLELFRYLTKGITNLLDARLKLAYLEGLCAGGDGLL